MEENLIRGIIFKNFPSLTAFAKAVNWNKQKASRVINYNQEPSLEDIQNIAKAVNEDADFIASIFLRIKSQK